MAKTKIQKIPPMPQSVPHESVVQVEQVVRELRALGITVLLVEHNMGLVMRLCDDIVVLDQGERIAQGDPASIRANRDVIRAYLGEEAVEA